MMGRWMMTMIIISIWVMNDDTTLLPDNDDDTNGDYDYDARRRR